MPEIKGGGLRCFSLTQCHCLREQMGFGEMRECSTMRERERGKFDSLSQCLSIAFKAQSLGCPIQYIHWPRANKNLCDQSSRLIREGVGEAEREREGGREGGREKGWSLTACLREPFKLLFLLLRTLGQLGARSSVLRVAN